MLAAQIRKRIEKSDMDLSIFHFSPSVCVTLAVDFRKLSIVEG